MSEAIEPGRALFVQVPLAVLHDPVVSHAAKLAYARLVLYAGRDGRCNPSHETLAAEVCLLPRQVRNVLSELRARGWITWKRTRSSCSYEITGPVPDRQRIATPETQDRQKIAAENGRKLPIKSGRKLPIKRCSRKEDSKISSSDDDAGTKWKPEDITQLRTELGKHRGRGDQPDTAITEKIVAHFGSKPEFDEWLSDLKVRVQPERISGNGYGFYATDAERYMTTKRSKQAEEQRKRDEHEAGCKGWYMSVIDETFQEQVYRVYTAHWCGCQKSQEMARTRGNGWLEAQLEAAVIKKPAPAIAWHQFDALRREEWRKAHPEEAA